MEIIKGKVNNFEFSWKQTELETWIKMGLIPNELLQPNKQKELFDFITSNIENLFANYKEGREDFDCQITLPPPNEWDKTYELQVINKTTGKVVKVLNRVEKFELCEGVVLHVNASELKLWKKETAQVKKLTKEQNECLKTFISECGKNRPLTRKEIVTYIREIQNSQKPKKYRQSGHLLDQKLKYNKSNYDILNTDILPAKIKKKIKESKLEVKGEGIKLTAPENKLDHALTRLLNEKSQTYDPKSKNYYSGNDKPRLTPYGNERRKSPVIRIKRNELYKAYLGKDGYTGEEAKYIDNLLIEFESKKYLIKYDYVKKVENEKGEIETLTDRIVEFTPLIKLLHFYPNLTDEEKKKLDDGDSKAREKKEEILIAYNPIYIDQIDTKFIEFPEDTNRRLMIAAGGWNKVTTSMNSLHEKCMQAISAKRYNFPINEDNLIKALGLEKYINQNRKKRLQERMNKDIEAVKKMGIILSSEKKLNKLGQFKWIFKLNKEYN